MNYPYLSLSNPTDNANPESYLIFISFVSLGADRTHISSPLENRVLH